MAIVKRAPRDQSLPIPPKKRRELADGAMEANAIKQEIDGMRRIAEKLQGAPLNVSGYRAQGVLLEGCLERQAAAIYKLLFVLADVGVEIAPVYSGEDVDAKGNIR